MSSTASTAPATDETVIAAKAVAGVPKETEM
jgi:hypothetical protein